MHRLLVSSELLTSECPTLPKDAERHLKVLRPEDGEAIELFDGQGKVRCYAYRPGEGLVAASAAVEFPRAAIPLMLFACVTKGSRWDWTIEKATELGVSRIVPVISDRTIVRIPQGERAAKRERWQRIAEDAARQSDAKWLPTVEAAVDFKNSLTMVSETECFVGALTDPAPRMLASAAATALRERKPKSVAVYVGPEGDFTPEELAALLKIATPTSFGASVLRAETAAIYAVSVLQATIEAVKSEE